MTLENKLARNNRFMKVLLVVALVSSLTSISSLLSRFIPNYNSNVYSAITIDLIESPINDTSMSNIMWIPYKNQPVITPDFNTEMAGEGGNLYAPEILIEDGIYKMWYGAQNENGHDQIHFATSDDGVTWNKHGVVIPNNDNNHVNDPTVVKVNGTYYMYYTTAPEAEEDVISLATSNDGINWTIIGDVLEPTSVGNWDSFKVGRPSVLYEDNKFKMWFDGMEVDPTDPTKWKDGTGRHVGYATSIDGITWTRYNNNPIFNNGGAIDVEKIDGNYYMVQESGQGTLWGYSDNETNFKTFNFLFYKTGLEFDLYGHVTPFILKEDDKWTATYVGVTTDKCWCQNRIGVFYPCQKIEVIKNDEVLKPDEVYMVSKSTITILFNTSRQTKEKISPIDNSWECKLRIYSLTGLYYDSSDLNIQKNTRYDIDCSERVKNHYIFSKTENKLYKKESNC
jgi:predicted GH43/DUF377 family glycosyl hydrolase